MLVPSKGLNVPGVVRTLRAKHEWKASYSRATVDSSAGGAAYLEGDLVQRHVLVCESHVGHAPLAHVSCVPAFQSLPFRPKAYRFICASKTAHGVVKAGAARDKRETRVRVLCMTGEGGEKQEARKKADDCCPLARTYHRISTST